MNQLTRDYMRTGFKRWVRWIVLAVIFAVACGFLANWQWNRRTQVVKAITRLDRNYAHSLVPIDTIVRRVDGFSIRYEFRPVLLSGHYLSDKSLLLRNQINNGNPGFDQLVPFQLDSGKVLTIDRGWLSTGNLHDLPDHIPAIVAGHVQIVGRLIHAQQPDSRQAPKGQAMAIRPQVLNQQWHLPERNLYTAVFGQLVAESPKSKVLPVLADKPELSEGNHLSYAFQWVLFAVLGFLTIAANIRQDLREKRTEEDPSYVPPVRRKRLGDADKEAEDALLDAAN